MTIKIDLAPKTVTAELGDYGVFDVRPMGVNEDLLLSQYAREIQEALDELSESNKKLTEGKISKDEQEKLAERLSEIVKKIETDKTKVIDVFKNLFSCEDQKQHDKLFNEVPLAIIREKYEEIIKHG